MLAFFRRTRSEVEPPLTQGQTPTTQQLEFSPRQNPEEPIPFCDGRGLKRRPQLCQARQGGDIVDAALARSADSDDRAAVLVLQKGPGIAGGADGLPDGDDRHRRLGRRDGHASQRAQERQLLTRAHEADPLFRLALGQAQ